MIKVLIKFPLCRSIHRREDVKICQEALRVRTTVAVPTTRSHLYIVPDHLRTIPAGRRTRVQRPTNLTARVQGARGERTPNGIGGHSTVRDERVLLNLCELNLCVSAEGCKLCKDEVLLLELSKS